jgi:signal transduction histidine kinase
MIHPDDREAVLGQLKRVQEGHAEPLEHRIIHRDGSVRWVRNTPVPRMDRIGNLVAYDGLISDITGRKLAEEKLKQANTELSAKHAELTKTLMDLKETRNLLIEAEKLEMVGQLAAGVAHEVKNPLAIILSGIEFLVQQPLAGDDTAKLVLKDMGDALNRADGVIRGLLDFAAGQQLGMNPENINEVIEATLSLMRHTFSKAGVAVSKVLLPVPPMVQMDRNKVEQVLVNVFLNAIHAMPEGGCLTVRTLTRVLAAHEVASDPGARGTDRFHAGLQVLVVEVDDTGSGLSPAVQGKLFEPFFTTKPTGQGTGLGLAVSKKILEMHGADISIKNRPEGGVRVTIIFKV